MFDSFSSLGNLENYVLSNYYNISAAGGFILNSINATSLVRTQPLS